MSLAEYCLQLCLDGINLRRAATMTERAVVVEDMEEGLRMYHFQDGSIVGTNKSRRHQQRWLVVGQTLSNEELKKIER